MKTSVIEVHDMLSVLPVDEVEKRISEVPGVESATVNYAAGTATVRYDETRLTVADIKVIVHLRGKQSAGDGHQEKAAPEAPPSASVAVAPKPSPVAPASVPAPTAPAGGRQQDKAAPDATVATSGATPAPTPPASNGLKSR